MDYCQPASWFLITGIYEKPMPKSAKPRTFHHLPITTYSEDNLWLAQNWVEKLYSRKKHVVPQMVIFMVINPNSISESNYIWKKKLSKKHHKFGTSKIHPQKLTWNLEMMVSNRNLLFQGSIFRWTMFVLGGVRLFPPRNVLRSPAQDIICSSNSRPCPPGVSKFTPKVLEDPMTIN